jgi:hypothetical protein
MPRLRDIAPDLIDMGGDIAGNLLTRRTTRNAAGALTGGIDQAGQRIADATNRAVGFQDRALEEQRGLAGTRRGVLRDASGRQEGLYRDRTALYAPYREGGSEGVAALRKLVEENPQFDVSKVTDDPGYRFGMDEGQKIIERANSARGVLNTGRAVKDLIRFANDYATTKVDAAEGRFNRAQQMRADRINALTGVGERAVAGTSAAASEFGNNAIDLARDESGVYGELGDQIGRSATNEGVLRLREAEALSNLDIDRGNVGAAEAVAGGNANRGLLDTAVNVGGSILNRVLGTGAATTAGVATPLLTAAGIPTALGAELAGLATIAQSAAPGSAAATAAMTPLTAAEASVLGGSQGLSGAITGFLTNPWTVGIGAALAVGSILWKKSQAHPKADEIVKTWEEPFHYNSLAPFAANWDNAVKSGKVTQQQGYEALGEYLQNYDDYLRKIDQWAGDDKNKKLVAGKSANNLWSTTVGPQLRRMQGEIAQLPQQVTV